MTVGFFDSEENEHSIGRVAMIICLLLGICIIIYAIIIGFHANNIWDYLLYSSVFLMAPIFYVIIKWGERIMQKAEKYADKKINKE